MKQNIQDQPKASNVAIGVIVVLLIISGGAYYLGSKNNSSVFKFNQSDNIITTSIGIINTSIPIQQPSPTIDLLSYTNQQYGYTIKYQNTLEISQADLKNARYSVILNEVKTTKSDVSQEAPPGLPVIYVSVIPDGFINVNSDVYNFMPTDLILI